MPHSLVLWYVVYWLQVLFSVCATVQKFAFFFNKMLTSINPLGVLQAGFWFCFILDLPAAALSTKLRITTQMVSCQESALQSVHTNSPQIIHIVSSLPKIPSNGTAPDFSNIGRSFQTPFSTSKICLIKTSQTG